MSPLLAIILTIAVIAALLWFFRGKPVFMIAFDDGDARVAHGSAPPAFLEDCRFIARDNALAAGRVSVIRGPHGLRMIFSHHLPPHVRQRLRNAWQVSGH